MNTEQALRERAEAIAEEIWDKYSQYIDDDIYSLQMVAGTTVMKKSDFLKAAIDFHKQELSKLGKVIYVPVEITDDDDIPFKIQVDGKWCWLKKLTL